MRILFAVLAAVLLLSPAIRAGEDALDEVNAARAVRGLPAFIKCDGLTNAAIRVADYRAANLIAGHSANDFAFLIDVSADAAGCAAWPASLGWGSCCTYESATHAGAAYCVGRDGRRYMHLFVRGRSSSSGCIGGSCQVERTRMRFVARHRVCFSAQR